MALIQYGGAIFDAKCPECGRITKPGKQLSVNRFMADVRKTAPANCNRCGAVRTPFVRFEEVA